MIVRIATDGQYRVAEDQSQQLHELDAEVVAAADARDAERFARAFAALVEFVRSGEALDDAHLGPSDAILAPPETPLDQAVAEWDMEALIP